MDHLFDTNISSQHTVKHTVELQHKIEAKSNNMPKVGVATGDNNKIQKRLGRNAIMNLCVYIVQRSILNF